MIQLATESGAETINHPGLNRRSSNRDSQAHNFPSTVHGSRRGEAMDIELPRRPNQSSQTNRSIRLCPEAIVANYDDQNDVKKMRI